MRLTTRQSNSAKELAEIICLHVDTSNSSNDVTNSLDGRCSLSDLTLNNIY